MSNLYRSSEIKDMPFNRQQFAAINEDVLLKPHRHNYFEIVITLENNFIHTVNGIDLYPARGYMVILRPGDVHSTRHIDANAPCKLRLIGFCRIHLRAGESTGVEFPLTKDCFALFDESGNRNIFSGEYTVYIGGSLPENGVSGCRVNI